MNIAAGIIADHGEAWQEEVLPEMRKGFSQLTTGDDGDYDSAKQLSVQGESSQTIQYNITPKRIIITCIDSIIVASLASIVGNDADRVKRLFVSSSCFAEGR